MLAQFIFNKTHISLNNLVKLKKYFEIWSEIFFSLERKHD